MFQSWKKRSQNFAFLDTLGYLVPVSPNDFSELYQIWHTSSQGSGASSCKILDTCVNVNYCFFAKNPKKSPKNPKFGFFGHICHSMTIRIMKFRMKKLVPHMNPHIKFQKLGFNSFRDIWFWIFSKFCNFKF